MTYNVSSWTLNLTPPTSSNFPAAPLSAVMDMAVTVSVCLMSVCRR